MNETLRIHQKGKSLFPKNFRYPYPRRTLFSPKKELSRYRKYIQERAALRTPGHAGRIPQNLTVIQPEIYPITGIDPQAKIGHYVNLYNRLTFAPGENPENEMSVIKALYKAHDYYFKSFDLDFLTLDTPKIDVINWMVGKLLSWCPDSLTMDFVEEDGLLHVHYADWYTDIRCNNGNGFQLKRFEYFRRSDPAFYKVLSMMFTLLHDYNGIMFYWEMEDELYYCSMAIECELEVDFDRKEEMADINQYIGYISHRNRSINEYYGWGGGRLRDRYEKMFGKFTVKDLTDAITKLNPKKSYVKIAMPWIESAIRVIQTGERIEHFEFESQEESDFVPIDLRQQYGMLYNTSKQDWIACAFDAQPDAGVQAGAEILGPCKSFTLKEALEGKITRSKFPYLLHEFFHPAFDYEHKIFNHGKQLRYQYAKRSVRTGHGTRNSLLFR